MANPNYTCSKGYSGYGVKNVCTGVNTAAVKLARGLQQLLNQLAAQLGLGIQIVPDGQIGDITTHLVHVLADRVPALSDYSVIGPRDVADNIIDLINILQTLLALPVTPAPPVTAPAPAVATAPHAGMQVVLAPPAPSPAAPAAHPPAPPATQASATTGFVSKQTGTYLAAVFGVLALGGAAAFYLHKRKQKSGSGSVAGGWDREQPRGREAKEKWHAVIRRPGSAVEEDVYIHRTPRGAVEAAIRAESGKDVEILLIEGLGGARGRDSRPVAGPGWDRAGAYHEEHDGSGGGWIVRYKVPDMPRYGLVAQDRRTEETTKTWANERAQQLIAEGARNVRVVRYSARNTDDDDTSSDPEAGGVVYSPSRQLQGPRGRAPGPGRSWRETPKAQAEYTRLRAEAQAACNTDGYDRGIEANDLFKSFNTFILPPKKRRSGHELRCEVVMCDHSDRCKPGYGPLAGAAPHPLAHRPQIRIQGVDYGRSYTNKATVEVDVDGNFFALPLRRDKHRQLYIDDLETGTRLNRQIGPLYEQINDALTAWTAQRRRG